MDSLDFLGFLVGLTIFCVLIEFLIFCAVPHASQVEAAEDPHPDSMVDDN